VLLAWPACAAAADDPALRADCDAPAFARVLQPAAQPEADARGYWLDRRHLRWPDAAVQPPLKATVQPPLKKGAIARSAMGDLRDDARYRLYVSAAGKLRTTAGAKVEGADVALELQPAQSLPAALSQRFAFTGPGTDLALDEAAAAQLPALLRGQLRLVREDLQGRVLDATALQLPGALDDLYAAAESATLGAGRHGRAEISEDLATRFALWAPTAAAVAVCLYPDDAHGTTEVHAARVMQDTGVWTLDLPGVLHGRAYAYVVDVFVPGTGIVRNRVTDPYSVGLTADSRRSVVLDLDHASTKPLGWDVASRPDPLASPTDMAIYELHVRDFSRDDDSVPAADRGRYLAFTHAGSTGMRHLRALREAGMTDVHLLPVFDLASVPETGCATPRIPRAATDSDAQQAAVLREAPRDCYNWGYDPFHFNAPEGSYAGDPADGAARVREFRAMVQALHAAGLRVGMDVVYNHTSASGQNERSVLDRIVPGYFHRLDAHGAVERSTCCDNTATEHRMMAKLMRDSAALWARHYRIDSFRFDLMGHQPRAEMERLQREVDPAAGRHIDLIGEGWNFGEIADGKRFVQASQLSLGGSGIGTFSDRARDAIRGGGPADRGEALRSAKGYVNGLADDLDACDQKSTTVSKPSPLRRQGPSVVDAADTKTLDPCLRRDDDQKREALLHAADLVRVGLAGTLRDFRMTDAGGREVALSDVDYKGQPAGYASEPSGVVNYVENHDNQTLFDIHAWKLPPETSHEDRARVQLLALALNAFSQGIAYFHAGGELMRSKSLDRNSYDSGDWFNRIDWTARDSHFGTGLPPQPDNGHDWPLMRPLLTDARIRPRPEDIAFVRDAFLDLLRIRASSTLFRMRTAADIRARLTFPNSGPDQNPAVMAGHLDGAGYPGAKFRELLYLVNVSSQAQDLELRGQRGKPYVLNPVQRNGAAADARPRRGAQYDAAAGRFVVPARTAVVYVVE
jgi:pullulanase/glycogen debranching enzyme